jgi:hypothetical protein
MCRLKKRNKEGKKENRNAWMRTKIFYSTTVIVLPSSFCCSAQFKKKNKSLRFRETSSAETILQTDLHRHIH